MVEFGTLPLVAASQKNTLLGTNKMENQLFMWQVEKSLVMKVVGLGMMHMSAKNRVRIQKFAMEVSKTMVTWVESQVNSYLVAFFVKSFL
jgi:hypothetical protein